MTTARQAVWFDRLLGLLEKGCTFIAGISLVLIMVWISADTSFRYLFNSPITGTSELIEDYLMVILIFLSLSITFTQGGHVNVTLFQRFFPKRILRWLSILVNLLGLVFFALLTASGWEIALRAALTNELASSILKYPMAPAYFMVPIGTGALTLRLLQALLEDLGIIKSSQHEKVEFAEI